MERRKFIQHTGMVAFGVGVFGNIRWDNDKYIGDNITTTDILGPFYRPNAPIRVNINPAGYTGSLFHLSGSVYKEDSKTPFSNCLVEIWQCDEHKVYDNVSDDFRYRGSQRVGKNGKYHFITTHPVPYPLTANSDQYRPAHIHMRISGEGQQDLITQIYFKDDPHLEKDPSSGSPEAISRILQIKQNSKKEEMVEFNVVMQKEFKPTAEVYKKITGIYEMNDNSLVEFYKDGDMLMVKSNGQIIEGVTYKGNNTFVGGGEGTNQEKVMFEITGNGTVKVKIEYYNAFSRRDIKVEGVKTFKY
jgi:protocatechuate 3,4-dioxygenase beta subunit